MANVFELTPDIKQLCADIFDDLIANSSVGGLGKTCRIVYPAYSIPCDNCLPDPFGGKSSNRHRAGGPVPFTATQPCPLCNGEGRKFTEETEEITLKCNWEPKKFFRPIQNVDVRIPNSVLETKCFMSDLPKLMKADHIVVNLPIEPYLPQKYKMSGEPGDPSNIIQARYVICYWSRA